MLPITICTAMVLAHRTSHPQDSQAVSKVCLDWSARAGLARARIHLPSRVRSEGPVLAFAQVSQAASVARLSARLLTIGGLGL